MGRIIVVDNVIDDDKEEDNDDTEENNDDTEENNDDENEKVDFENIYKAIIKMTVNYDVQNKKQNVDNLINQVSKNAKLIKREAKWFDKIFCVN